MSKNSNGGEVAEVAPLLVLRHLFQYFVVVIADYADEKGALACNHCRLPVPSLCERKLAKYITRPQHSQAGAVYREDGVAGKVHLCVAMLGKASALLCTRGLHQLIFRHAVDGDTARQYDVECLSITALSEYDLFRLELAYSHRLAYLQRHLIGKALKEGVLPFRVCKYHTLQPSLLFFCSLISSLLQYFSAVSGVGKVGDGRVRADHANVCTSPQHCQLGVVHCHHSAVEEALVYVE
mmetsp:Transcript_33924/g.87107  ORF Transcript_33924/g.87107 Transcript_33924/m.87107 type:complete len:238 (-) Transcript_33924:203-916(-)